MDKNKFIEDFKKCKIKAIDIVFEETSKKLGINHTRNALKFILLDDQNILGEDKSIEDKYLYISSKSGGRELLKLLDIYDVYQILSKFCMEMCAINDLKFTELEPGIFKNISDNKIIEYVAYLLYSDLNKGFEYLKDKKILIRIFDSFIDNRYKNNLLMRLDSAHNLMNNKYFDRYIELDSYFDKQRENTI